MTTASDFNAAILKPSLAWFSKICPRVPVTPAVCVLMLAIAGQESEWRDIAQEGGGPGRGPYQFEPETCGEILANPVTEIKSRLVCATLDVRPFQEDVYKALIGNPRLYTAFARFDLLCDDRPIPTLGDQAGALECYKRVWRPGAFRPDDWPKNYGAALALYRSPVA